MKSHKILLFIAIVIALLASICVLFPKDGITVCGKSLHFPTLTKILNPERQVDLDSLMAAKDLQLQEHNDLMDSINFFSAQIDSSNLRFWFPNNDPSFFDSFFERAAKPQGRTLRVLHYGDSQIEMDRLSCRLRVWMQNTFGGTGPGMMHAKTIIGSYAISQYAQGALTLQTCFGGDSLSMISRANGNYGPMVQCFHLGGGATIDFKAPTNQYADERVKSYSTVGVVFNNRPGPLTVTLTDRIGGYTNTQQCEESGVHTMWWKLDSASSSIHLSLSGNADIYGVMLDGPEGVSVDNIPMRGCSGQQFCMINQDQLAAAYSQMNIGLIILQFGGNSVPYLKGTKSISTYCQNIGRQIDRIHECCPEAKILFIGPSDMSTTINGELQTYRDMEDIISGLRDTALAHNAAYWSIYHAMGGHNSMLAWNTKGWAGSDYIHFTGKGAVVMGDMLADAFDRIHTLYLMRKELHEKTHNEE